MKITLDIKTLILGFLCGVLFSFALGAYGGSGGAGFGIAVPSGGKAVIKTERGAGYVLEPSSGRAIRINYTDGFQGDLF